MSVQNFDFFDQFPEMEIDLTDYLKKFSDKIPSFKLSNFQPAKVRVKNLFEKYELKINIQTNTSQFEPYIIQDYEKVETISHKKYGTTDFWWLILVINNIKDMIAQYPVTQAQLNDLVDRVYAIEGIYSKDTYYKFLFEENEKKRLIYLPIPSFLYEIIYEYRKKVLDGI